MGYDTAGAEARHAVAQFRHSTHEEDRVARRKEEIESLQEALRILNGEDVA